MAQQPEPMPALEAPQPQALLALSPVFHEDLDEVKEFKADQSLSRPRRLAYLKGRVKTKEWIKTPYHDTIEEMMQLEGEAPDAHQKELRARATNRSRYQAKVEALFQAEIGIEGDRGLKAVQWFKSLHLKELFRLAAVSLMTGENAKMYFHLRAQKGRRKFRRLPIEGMRSRAVCTAKYLYFLVRRYRELNVRLAQIKHKWEAWLQTVHQCGQGDRGRWIDTLVANCTSPEERKALLDKANFAIKGGREEICRACGVLGHKAKRHRPLATSSET